MQSLNHILHITPALPPLVNGLGDFCSLLAKNLEKNGYTNSFFAMKHDVSHITNRAIAQFNQHDLYKNLEEQKPRIIILQYAGYGYHTKGLPFYLLAALKKFKQKHSCRILVFFHELYSSSNSPLKLSFYTNASQKMIVKGLYKLADKTFTNCSLYEDLLRRLLLKNPEKNTCTGIYSNIPDELYDETIIKDNRAVVFGTQQRRNEVYNSPFFQELISRNNITGIDDIGPGKTLFTHSVININARGCLSPHEAAVYLNHAKFGLINYPPGLLAKSSIFSAYSAFGLIPINVFEKNEPLYDDLVKGKNYFTAESIFSDHSAYYEAIRKDIKHWYEKRSQRTVANTVLSQL